MWVWKWKNRNANAHTHIDTKNPLPVGIWSWFKCVILTELTWRSSCLHVWHHVMIIYRKQLNKMFHGIFFIIKLLWFDVASHTLTLHAVFSSLIGVVNVRLGLLLAYLTLNLTLIWFGTPYKHLFKINRDCIYKLVRLTLLWALGTNTFTHNPTIDNDAFDHIRSFID